jgi:hexosaminidase
LDAYQENPEIAPTTIGNYTTLKKSYSYEPVPATFTPEQSAHIIGVQANVWTEYMQNDERRDYQTFPRAQAIAEVGWTQSNRKDWSDFCRRMPEEFERMDVMGVKACRNFFDVNVNTHVFADTLKVVLETYYPGAEIRYTTDGTTPGRNSARYTSPFQLKGKILLKAGTFLNGKLLGKIAEKALYGNRISGKQYTTFPHASWINGDTFGANDVLGADSTTLALTNGKRGYTAFTTPWVVFYLNERNDNRLVFNVDMQQPVTVNRVVFGTLYNNAYRILPASAARVEVSANGTDYKEVGSAEYRRTYPERGRKMYTDTLTCTPTQARYLRLTLNSGGTLRNGIDCRQTGTAPLIPSALAVDEVEVY